MRARSFLSLCLIWAVVHGQGGEGDEAEGDDIMLEPLTSQQMHTIHHKADADSNGKVSLKEVMDFSQKMDKEIALHGAQSALEQMDRNGDGSLDLQEILDDIHDAEADSAKTPDAAEDEDAQAVREQEAAKFKAADVSGDGRLQVGELPGFFYPESDDGALTVAAAATMEAKDTNLDGKLTAKEFWQGDIPEGGAGVPITKQEGDDFKKLDLNGDNLVDLEELKRWESGSFDTEKVMISLMELADKDGDHHLTHAELVAEAANIAKSEAQHTMVEWALHYEL